MSELATLLKKLSHATGLSEKDLKKVFSSLPDALLAVLKDQGSLTIRNLMRVSVSNRPPTKGINPQTRESIFIPAKKTVRAKFSKPFVNKLNQASSKIILYYGSPQVPEEMNELLIGWDIMAVESSEHCKKLFNEHGIEISAFFVASPTDVRDYLTVMKYINGQKISGLIPVISLCDHTLKTPDGGRFTVHPDLALNHAPATPDDLENFVRTVESIKADSEFFLNRILVESTGHEAALSELIEFSKDICDQYFRARDDEKRERFINAITEAVNNAFFHGHNGNEEKNIRMNITRDPKQVSVTVEDQGEGFDSASYLDGSTEDKHGLGITVIKSGTDKVIYFDKGRKVTLTKTL